MKDVYNEVLKRFPEIKPNIDEGDEESPYLYFSYIAWWVESLSRSEVTSKVIDRIGSFGEWCCKQPEGKDASDDLGTILMTGLYESLANSASGRKVLANIFPLDYLRSGEEYFKQWMGEMEYEQLLAEYQ